MLRCCLLLAAIACTATQAEPRATVELLPVAEVSRETVKLGDVARLNSPDLALMRSLVDLPVGRAPAAGQAAVVQRDVLEAWVRRRLPGEQSLEWRGAEQSRVSRLSRELQPDEIGKAAVQALRSWLADRGIEGEVQVRHAIRAVPVPAGEIRLQVRSLEHAQLGPRMLVWVDAWAGGNYIRSVPVSLAVAWTEPPLSSALHSPSAGSVGRGTGASAISEQPWVLRGEWASLRTIAGAVLLESRVEVLQDGRRGQKVRVRQPGAAALVFAKVVAPGELELAP